MGFVPPEGPENAPILIMGEAPGYEEQAIGRPFVGAAGSMLERILRRNRLNRGQFRIGNILSCFPGDTLVHARGVQKGYRRWYVGELVTVHTPRGELTGTPNHPALTPRGWVALGELVESDHLICGTFSEREAGGDPDVEAGPAQFAQAFDTLADLAIRERVVGSTLDFHGDGGEAEIEVVRIDRLLRDGLQATPTQHLFEHLLSASYKAARLLEPNGARAEVTLYLGTGYLASLRREVGGLHHPSPLRERQPFPLTQPARTPIANRLTSRLQDVAEVGTPHSEVMREGSVGLPRAIAMASIIKIERRQFSGHVYNLSTTSEEYLANGFIVHNCVPPGMQLEGMPYQHTAINHCAVHRDKVLNENHPVVLATGGTALKTLLGLHGMERIRVEEFHGTVHDDMEGRFKVVPTFHTSYLQRGAHNLIGTVSFDLQVALEVARGEWTPEPIELIIDPPVAWFEAWVVQLELSASLDPDGVAVACDIETPDKAGGKPENELTPDDDSYQITRWNFACHPDQGVTVPNDPAYMTLVQRILALKIRHYWWNGYGYDWARIAAAGYVVHPLMQIDLMIGAHVLQSDVPLGLGFWAPFYSRYGAWKHFSATDPEKYACIDGPQTLRCGYGIIGDLIQQGQWRAFQEDCHELYHGALKPAQDVGILIDREELGRFHDDLAGKQLAKLEEMQQHVPAELRPLTLETGTEPDPQVLHPSARTHTLRGELKKDQPDPIKAQLYARALRVERNVSRTIQVCLTCGAAEVSKTHRCKDDRGKIDKTKHPAVVPQERLVIRWFWQEPFNPDSSKQMLQYIKLAGHKPGKNKKTREDSADRETLIRLAKSTKDPFYQVNLDYRAVKKIDSTYALPTMRRVDRELAEGREGRLHPIPTFRPSTMRLSYVSPNITNVVVDKDSAKKNLAGGFRRCVVAAPGCRLLEVDYSGIEAIETGWFSRDPAYIRLAKLGVHAYLASHLLGRAADLRWSDADLLAYFSELKKAHFLIYDQAKRCVHGTNYGLTPYGMANTFPDLYRDEREAHRVQQIYFEICPTLPTWHGALRQQAYDTGYLGGPGEVLTGVDNACYKAGWKGASPWAHPFQYKHWFWSVLAYKPITESQRLRRVKAKKPSVEINGRWFSIELGEDSKRVIAFYPQSTARGVLTRPMRNLFTRPDHPSYIGDAYYGRTPFRAPIHDSLLLEIPDRNWDRVCELVFREMQRPIAEQPLPQDWGMGRHLSVGIEAKAGHNWLEVEKIPIVGVTPGLAEETYFGAEEEDEEEVCEMRTVA